MLWLLEGKNVNAFYQNKKVSGTVLQSFTSRTINSERPVVLHKVKLDNPITVSWSNNKKDTILIDHEYLVQ